MFVDFPTDDLSFPLLKQLSVNGYIDLRDQCVKGLLNRSPALQRVNVPFSKNWRDQDLGWHIVTGLVAVKIEISAPGEEPPLDLFDLLRAIFEHNPSIQCIEAIRARSHILHTVICRVESVLTPLLVSVTYHS